MSAFHAIEVLFAMLEDVVVRSGANFARDLKAIEFRITGDRPAIWSFDPLRRARLFDARPLHHPPLILRMSPRALAALFQEGEDDFSDVESCGDLGALESLLDRLVRPQSALALRSSNFEEGSKRR